MDEGTFSIITRLWGCQALLPWDDVQKARLHSVAGRAFRSTVRNYLDATLCLILGAVSLLKFFEHLSFFFVVAVFNVRSLRRNLRGIR